MDNQKTNQKIGEICVIVSAVFFGVMPLLAKTAYSNGSNSYSVAFYRFFFGAILLFFIVNILQRDSVMITAKQIKWMFILSIPYACMPILLYKSYNYISSGLATTLHFTYPVFVMILSAIAFREHAGTRKIFSCISCILGIAFLYTPDGSVSVLGIIMALISGIVYGIYVILLGRSGLDNLSVLKQGFWLSVFSALEIGVVAVYMDEFTMNIQSRGWIAQMLLALLTTVIALVLFQKGTYICGSVKASLLSAFEPLTGVAVGVTILHESLNWKIGLGILLILASTVLQVLPENQADNL